MSLASFTDFCSPTSTVFYTVETFQDEHLTIKYYCARRSLRYADAVQCSQISDSASQASSDEAYDDMDSEKGILRPLSVQQGIKLKLRTPPFQSLYITSASFYKKIQNPSQQKATEACDHSRLSTQPTLTGEMFTNPKVVSSVTDAKISSSIPCDWHRNADVLQSCLAHLYVIQFYT
ncbi:hypothetical protein EV421DRAFT_1912515 [Armillaria borealis]|uniref:Uncharacterized protein n=1 Tax=Armillaria borealis TaxID=47425 RepID=A0AA39MDZ5_9AGAR|nr:hypothetical protein EV421DRAFT_1912515 [Armillaria borealis]